MYVLRDQAGEIITESSTMPDDFGFPFITFDGRECYWAIEFDESCQVCDAIGGYCGGGSCPPRS